MPTLVGIVLALVVGAFARIVGLDRDRAFYPTVLIVVGSYYVLFAVMAGADAGLSTELLVFALFAAAATFGFRTSLWIVAAGLAAHGLFDFTRHWFMVGRGVPEWWPAFCGAFDLAAGAVLAAILLIEKRKHGPRFRERRDGVTA